ncbi:fimbrial protein [Citrobacter farmeri]|uniref:fimbrial protein n=1 Tax=Citrobacter farmeri TaxID=67824 RepID=UPI001C8CDE53|nr:fimbrial protein [Citrobacter farmeri]
MNICRRTFIVARILATMLFFSHSFCHAAFVLKNCFPNRVNYAIDWSYDLSPADNAQGKLVSAGVLVGNGPPLSADCECTAAISGSSVISDVIYVTSPLQTGSTAGYGYLTSHLDLDIDVYTNTDGATSISSLIQVSINSYPTTSPISKVESQKIAESDGSVCRAGTQPVPGTPARQFSWNAINARLYIKSPILGVETIPPTLVAQVAVCLYNTTGCTASASYPAASLYLSGTISAPLSCTINAGSTIEVDLGNLVSTNFVHKGSPPDGFALKAVDINFHCDSAAVSNSDKIKLTLSADQGVSDGESGLIAKMVDRDDIGVRMYDSNSHDVRLDGTAEFPVVLDSRGNGSIKMQAAPVSTTANPPKGGKFEGNVTVKMDIK